MTYATIIIKYLRSFRFNGSSEAVSMYSLPERQKTNRLHYNRELFKQTMGIYEMQMRSLPKLFEMAIYANVKDPEAEKDE